MNDRVQMPAPPIPIAVIGISCRFPGGAHDLPSFWKLLAEGQNVWSDVPENRFVWSSFSSSSRSHGWDSAYGHRGGHFLTHDVACFDARFFSIGPAEAGAMDPQQRLQLEVAYEALENAGLPLERVKGSNTSVHVATFTHDYENMMYKDATLLPKYSMTGVGQAIVSNRVSYVFDLKGPSMTLDTGCSGSLVALHLACQGLRTGESDMALVGGSNLMLNPDTMIPMDLLHFLNQDGRSFSFDSRGSGYGRGEGVAMLVLKRLDRALIANDPIRTVICNTAVGQDGTTTGITLPNGAAQQHLISSLYEASRLNPCETGYIEAHGTGTSAGDSVEIEVINEVFCRNRLAEKPLYVGSVKANIGHLESASGLAGLIKAILVLEKKQIPAISNLKTVKSELKPFLAKIKLNRELVKWPIDVVRRASVNSFGYGGTNAHVIIESLEERHNPTNQCDGACNQYLVHQKAKILTITADSQVSLLAALEKLRWWSLANDAFDADLASLAYTLTVRRTLMSWRYTFVASTHEEFLSSLETTALRTTKSLKTNNIIFIFNGQGAQWSGMTKELLATSFVFKNSITQSDAILTRLGSPWSLLEELAKCDELSRIYESEIGQPASTAVQIALVDLLQDLNVKPYAILGHSSGEIAAAYAAHALTHESAIEVSYYRSFLRQRCKTLLNVNGAMLAVSMGEEELRSYLSRLSSQNLNRVVIACSNSPSSTVVSGDEDAVFELQAVLQTFAISTKRLKVDAAYHSHHMQAVARNYLDDLRHLKSATTAVETLFYSSVTAAEKMSDFGPSYWVTNLVSKVRFFDALRNMLSPIVNESMRSKSQVAYTFLEVGPHNVLAGPIKQTLTSLGPTSLRFSYLFTLRRNHNTLKSLLRCTAALFEQGCDVNLSRANTLSCLNSGYPVITDLPPYRWDHSNSYWHESDLSRRHRFRSHPFRSLLGLRNPGDTLSEPTWTHTVSVETLPWLREHCIDGRMIFPASGYIAMAIEAKAQIVMDRHGIRKVREFLLRDLEFVRFLEISDSAARIRVQISLRRSVSSSDQSISAWEECRVSSVFANGATNEHFRCLIKVELDKPIDCNGQGEYIDFEHAANPWDIYQTTLESKLA